MICASKERTEHDMTERVLKNDFTINSVNLPSETKDEPPLKPIQLKLFKDRIV